MNSDPRHYFHKHYLERPQKVFSSLAQAGQQAGELAEEDGHQEYAVLSATQCLVLCKLDVKISFKSSNDENILNLNLFDLYSKKIV